MECRYKLGNKSYKKSRNLGCLCFIAPNIYRFDFLFFIPTVRIFLSFTDTNTITNVSNYRVSEFSVPFQSQCFEIDAQHLCVYSR